MSYINRIKKILNYDLGGEYMPFDFVKHKNYTIEYTKILEELMEKKILLNKDIQYQYIMNWMTVLKHHDDILFNQFRNQDAIEEYIVKVRSEPEIFQLPVHWNNQTIFMHFRASIANEICKDYYSYSSEIPIEDFIGDDRGIWWTEVDDNVDGYVNNSTPVIAVPYFSGKANLLIIDGNHRITYHVRKHSSSVKTIIISEQSAIEYQIFTSSFDMMYYIFNNELVRYANSSAEGNKSDLELISKSFLSGKGFQFCD